MLCTKLYKKIKYIHLNRHLLPISVSVTEHAPCRWWLLLQLIYLATPRLLHPSSVIIYHAICKMLLAVLLILAFFLIVNLMIAIIIGVLSLGLRLGVLGLIDALAGVEINRVLSRLWVVEMSWATTARCLWLCILSVHEVWLLCWCVSCCCVCVLMVVLGNELALR